MDLKEIMKGILFDASYLRMMGFSTERQTEWLAEHYADKLEVKPFDSKKKSSGGEE